MFGNVSELWVLNVVPRLPELIHKRTYPPLNAHSSHVKQDTSFGENRVFYVIQHGIISVAAITFVLLLLLLRL